MNVQSDLIDVLIYSKQIAIKKTSVFSLILDGNVIRTGKQTEFYRSSKNSTIAIAEFIIFTDTF